MKKRFFLSLLPVILLSLFFNLTKNNNAADDNSSEQNKISLDKIGSKTTAEDRATILEVGAHCAGVNSPVANATGTTQPKQTFTLVKSDRFGTTVNFQLPDFSIETKNLSNNESYSVIEAEGKTHPMNKKGYPALPVYKQEILIPVDSTPELVVSTSNYREVSVEKPLPAVGPVSRQQTLPEPSEAEFYSSTEVFPAVEVEMKDSFSFRGLRAVTVTVYPFLYDNGNNKLRVYDNISFAVKTADSAGILMGKPLKIADFQRSASETFINYEAAAVEYEESTGRSLPSSEIGHLLVVYPSKFASTITDFVNWKRQIGFEVETALYPSDTGASVDELKTFIDGKRESGVSHVVLMGESTDIPSRIYYYKSAKWYDEETYVTEFGTTMPSPTTYKDYIIYSDLYYAGIEYAGSSTNSDYVYDLYVSRFSDSDASSLRAQLDKVISYERGDMFVDRSSNWLYSVLLTASDEGGSSAYKGRTDYQHLDALKESLATQSDYSNFTTVYDYPVTQTSPDKVTSALNAGAGLTYYLGHGSYSRWSTTRFSSSYLSDIRSGLPALSVQPVCQTGGFFSGCFAESQMKSDSFIGVVAATNNTWWNPPMVQLEEFTENVIEDSYDTVGGLVFDSIYQATSWASSYSGAFYRDCTAAQLHYFGDCSMGFRTRKPASLELSFNDYVEKNSNLTIKVTADGFAMPNATVTLTSGESVIKAKTNYQGIASFTSPSQNGVYRVTAWERNAIATEKNITVGKVYTVSTPSLDADSDVLNLDAVIDGEVISIDNDLFYIENGVLKAKSDLDITEPVDVNVTYLDGETNTVQTTTTTISSGGSGVTYHFQLAEGWNLIGSPVNSAVSANNIFVDSSNKRLVSTDLFCWPPNATEYSEVSLSSNLVEQQAFWVHSNKNTESADFSGSGTRGVMTDLNVGWNLYSPVTPQSYPSGSAAVWMWNVLEQKYDQLTEDQALEPLAGYWIFMMP